MSSTSPHPVDRRPVLRIAGLATIAFAALLLIVVLLFDLSWLKGPIERRVAERTGRVLILGGDISGTRSFTPRLSFRDARSAIHLRGTFADPSVSVDADALAARVAGSVLLGLPNPLAALIPLIETGGGEDAPCEELLRDVRNAAKNTAPGK